MTIENADLSPSVFILVFTMLLLAAYLAFFRLARGPTLPDRVVALELITTLTVGMIVVYTIAADQPVYLDAAIVVALVSFLGTIALAQFVERRARDG
jgi:multicomponent Na+:H+ antiporter subunit F